MWNGDGRRPGCKGWWVSWNEYPAGKRKCKTRKFDDRHHAVIFVNRYNSRSDLEFLGEVVPYPFRDAKDEFIAGCSQLAANSILAYDLVLKAFERHVSKDVCRIIPSDIDAYLASMTTQSPSTVKKHLAHIHRFFNWCVLRNYASENPCKKITSKPKARPRKKEIPTDEELARFIDELDTEDRRIAVRIAISTGMDREVIVSLTAKDLDLEDGVFRVTRRKTGKRLVIPIHPDLQGCLRQRAGGSGVLLCGLSRQKKHKDWFRLAAARAGLPDTFVFQTLRAVASTRLMRQGLPAQEVQVLLGHSTIQTTLNHYFAADPDMVRRFQSLPLP